MAKKQKKDIPEEAILFPEIEVDGIKVKPWSLGQLAELAPTLEEIFVALSKLDIEIENLTFTDLMRLQFTITPFLPKLLSVTLALEEDVVKKYNLATSTKILGTIWMQNKESLGNALSLFGAETPNLLEETAAETE